MKKWAFLVHPRDRYDLKVAYGYSRKTVLKLFPDPRILSKIDGFAEGGFLIVLPFLPEDMYKYPKKTRLKIFEGVNFAQTKGVSVIGLGELTAPFTYGGRWLLDKISSKILVTNGNTLTAGIVAREVDIILEEFSDGALIGIVGATGSIGSAVTHLLAEKKRNLLLVARNEMKLVQLVERVRSHTKVAYTTNLQMLTKVDIVLVLTSGSGSIIKPEYLKSRAIVYDITQPSNVSDDLLEVRPDVTLIKGGLVTNPGIKLGTDLRLPNGTLFACLAETVLLAEKDFGLSSFSLTGSVDPELGKIFVQRAITRGFRPALLRTVVERK